MAVMWRRLLAWLGWSFPSPLPPAPPHDQPPQSPLCPSEPPSHCGLTLSALLERCHYTYDQWNAVLKRDPCVYCGTFADPTIEHVTPIGRRRPRHGGPPQNKVCACGSCNNRRGDTPLLMFLVSQHETRRERVMLVQHPSSLRASISERIQWKRARR